MHHSKSSLAFCRTRRWFIALTAVFLGACGASAPGMDGAGTGSASAAASGSSSPAVDSRDSPEGGDDAGLAMRAARGLAISPVPLSLDRKTGRERRLIGLGSYIVNAASDCAGCHSTPAGFLAGGNPFPLGGGQIVRSRNLTPDPTTGLPLTRDQFFEAVRTGRDFHAGQETMLVVMPWTTLRWASDLDLDAIYAYLRAVPPVKNAVPADVKDKLPLPASVAFDPATYTDGVVVRKLKGAHQSFSASRGLSVSPVVLDVTRGDEGPGRSVGLGSYIANVFTHCNDCHTHPDRAAGGSKVNTASFLAGGTVFTAPPPLRSILGYVRATSANLEGATNGYFREAGDSYQRFRDIVRTGTLVDQVPPRPLAFPMNLVAPNLALLLEGDLRAVYDFLKAVPPTTGASDVPHQPPARHCAAAANCRSGETCSDGECTGGACTGDLDCGTCQTCGSGNTCEAPAADSVCVLTSQ